MADLQDTNAATEEIYGPLLIVDCPVTDEMIFQSSGRTAACTREKSLLLVPVHYLLITCFGWKPLEDTHPRNDTLAVNVIETMETSEGEKVKVPRGIRVMEHGKQQLFKCKLLMMIFICMLL